MERAMWRRKAAAMRENRYYQLRPLVYDWTDARTGERYLTPDCGHAVIQSHMDKPRGGYLRCRFCPKVAKRPMMPGFDQLGRELEGASE